MSDETLTPDPSTMTNPPPAEVPVDASVEAVALSDAAASTDGQQDAEAPASPPEAPDSPVSAPEPDLATLKAELDGVYSRLQQYDTENQHLKEQLALHASSTAVDAAAALAQIAAIAAPFAKPQ